MKLKCDTHKRRVVTGSQSFLHRNGDGSKCDSPTATIGDKTVSRLPAPEPTMYWWR